MGRLNKVFFLVELCRIEQELSVNHAEVLSVFMNPAFAQEEHLLSSGHGFHGYRPFFQRQLAIAG